MESSKEPALRALFEHSSVGIIISRPDGMILDANPYVSKMFGYENGELANQKIEVLLPQRIREKHIGFRTSYNQKPEPRSMGVGRELSAIKKNGDEFPVEISLSSFNLDSQLRIVSFINDVTETQRYRQKLESLVDERTKELSHALIELNSTNKSLLDEMRIRKIAEEKALESLKKEQELSELKTRFVSMASHEFRTPLAGIMTSVSLLQKYMSPGYEDKREKHFSRIKSLIRNLTGILNDFLSLGKLEQSSVRVSSQYFEIRDFTDQLIEDLSDSESHKRVITVFYPAEECLVFLDKDFLRNILTNLLTNAIKYSDHGTAIELSIKDLGESITFEVKDYGVGIPLSDQKNLFERFFRARNVDTIQGTGLGLNIVKRYVKLLHGEIHFKSEEDKGSTFTVTLPRKVEHA